MEPPRRCRSMTAGLPRRGTRASNSHKRRRPPIEVSTTRAGASRVKLSTMARMRKRLPQSRASETNSRLQCRFGASGSASVSGTRAAARSSAGVTTTPPNARIRRSATELRWRFSPETPRQRTSPLRAPNCRSSQSSTSEIPVRRGPECGERSLLQKAFPADPFSGFAEPHKAAPRTGLLRSRTARLATVIATSVSAT